MEGQSICVACVFAADDGVSATGFSDGESVVASAAVDAIVACAAVDQIVTCASNDAVVARPCCDRVIASASEHSCVRCCCGTVKGVGTVGQIKSFDFSERASGRCVIEVIGARFVASKGNVCAACCA